MYRVGSIDTPLNVAGWSIPMDLTLPDPCRHNRYAHASGNPENRWPRLCVYPRAPIAAMRMDALTTLQPAASRLRANWITVDRADGLVVRRAGGDQSPWEISAFLELKTVWHPVGT